MHALLLEGASPTCSSPVDGSGGGLERAAVIAAATSSRIRPRTAASDRGVTSVAGGGEERDVPGSSVIVDRVK